VVVFRYLDVYLLSHLCASIMEKAKEKLELITQYFTEFTPLQIQQLSALEALYKDWNSKINVISRKDEDHLYEKHVLHSLSVAAVFNFKDGMSVLDLGTGGGFPGIPLAIFFPSVNFYLADSIGKKIKVVQAVADELELKNVTAHHTRVEDIKNKKFDTVVSRAVAPLGELWKWSKPLLKNPPAQPRHPLSQMGSGNRPAKSDNSGVALSPFEKGGSFAEGETGDLPVPYGLVCLKGGDLAAEISESGCRPKMMEIFELFPHESFKEKFILYVPV
jgi:16S rRNA (guanine527-N7)-methyltransferase